MKPKQIPILMYHEIGDYDNPWCISPKNLEEQLQWLKEQGYQTISLTQLKEIIDVKTEENKPAEENKSENVKKDGNHDAEIEVGKKIVLTFDDARKGVYTYAYPLLKKYGFTASLFVVPGWLNGQQVPTKEGYSFMKWEELREMSENDFEICSHSFSHQNMAQLAPTSVITELEQADKEIREKLNVVPQHFAYPYGKFNTEIAEMVLQRYSTAVATIKGFDKTPGKFARQWVLHDTSLEEFKELLRPPKLSLCMIVRNEEGSLAKCLNSVRDLVDEIIIVDTGSTDRTKEIARTFEIYGAKVYDFTWVDDFSAARNESLERATGDWILVLDADEVMAEANKEVIREALNQKSVDGFRLMTRNYTNDSSASGWQPVLSGNNLGDTRGDTQGDTLAEGFQGWVPSLKIRLFRNKPSLRFKGSIHEMIDETNLNKEALAALPAVVHHYGMKANPEKLKRYLELTQKKITENPQDAKAYFELGVQYRRQGKLESAEQAFRNSLKLDPQPALPRLNLAQVLQKQGRLDEAGENFQQVLAGGKEKTVYYAEACFGLGYGCYQKKELDQAIHFFELAVQNNPCYLDAYLNLGALYEKKGEYAQAIASLKQAAVINPQSGRLYYNIGVVWEKQLNLKMALVCYEKALDLGYSNPELADRVKKMKPIL